LLRSEEIAILEKIKKGETAAFRKIINEYELAVSNTIISFIGKTPEAEEIAQEVFIRFLKKIPGFRGDSGIKTYLVRIAINLSLNELKKRKVKYSRLVSNEDITGDIEDPDSHSDKFELKEAIHDAINGLDERIKAVVILRLVEGFSTRETAKILKIPQGTVLSRLSRGQDQLKEKLSHLKHE
jgi:RNA polymerase sigma-70 factor (ECF subfamily)